MDLLAPLREAPDESALLFDVDGTLAPIAPRPQLAFVPPETKLELARLAARYLLVACISGRAGEEAAALVGVDGIRYVGNHGLELDERASELTARVAAFRDSVGLPVEDKGLSLSYHYRGARNEEAARAELERVAERADTFRHAAVHNPKRTVPVAAIVAVGALAVGIAIWRRRH